ncbi:MAG: cytochrome c peroxidase [Bacteroidota bacterium]
MLLIRSYIFLGVGSLFLVLTACEPVPEMTSPDPWPTLMEIPEGFPPVEAPEGNEFTQARWELGKKLFYDTNLSLDRTVSCASCHQQDLAFADSRAVSAGIEGRLGSRNSPSLANVAYHPHFTREGGVPTLEMQVGVPIQEHNEFGIEMIPLVERLAADPVYEQMAWEAYERPVDPFVITRALSCFERSLLSGNSLFDQWERGDNPDAWTAREQRGYDLFISERTGCTNCHGGFNFTDYSFQNNGLYAEYEDSGRFRLTALESDRGLFKVPSLRNVALSPPYMHDGSLENLDAVLDHYSTGGKGAINQSPLITPLSLSAQEKEDLIAFLESLTDWTFVQNPLFQE